MRNVLKALILAVVAVTAVASALPASAKAPTRETFTDEGWFTLPDIPCTGFTLTEVMDHEAIRVTTFYNRVGDPVKIATRANFFGTITNSATGQTFRDHASFTETINVPEGTTTVNGISYHYVVKAQGQVYAEIGHKISITATGEVIFQGGQDDLAGDPDLLSLCTSLA